MERLVGLLSWNRPPAADQQATRNWMEEQTQRIAEEKQAGIHLNASIRRQSAGQTVAHFQQEQAQKRVRARNARLFDQLNAQEKGYRNMITQRLEKISAKRAKLVKLGNDAQEVKGNYLRRT
jgi:hypothetical protein